MLIFRYFSLLKNLFQKKKKDDEFHACIFCYCSWMTVEMRIKYIWRKHGQDCFLLKVHRNVCLIRNRVQVYIYIYIY